MTVARSNETVASDSGAIHTIDADGVSVNERAHALVEALIADAAACRVAVERVPEGPLLIDAGIDVRGGIEAGLRIARICMGGYGEVELVPRDSQAGVDKVRWPYALQVRSSHPVLACLASQYAGWNLSHGEGKGKFVAMGSGPARALAVREELFGELAYRDRSAHATLVLEVDRRPPAPVLQKVVADCGVDARALTVILTPTTSLAGGTQIVARVLEVALHKAHALGFPLSRIVDGVASAPLPPPSGDFLQAMSRTNDAILFSGMAQLFVDAPDDAARKLAEQLPSSASRDYGRPFGEIFKACEYDFYRIDPMLFAPAQAIVTALPSGRSFAAGRCDEDGLAKAFGGEILRAGGSSQRT